MSTKQWMTVYSIFAALAATLGIFAVASISSHHLAVGAEQSNVTKVFIVQGASTHHSKGFSPKSINIHIGDSVTWTNNDFPMHTVTSGTGLSDANKGKDFDSGYNTLMTIGKIYSHQFTKKGEFVYFCQLHPAMTGKVSVS